MQILENLWMFLGFLASFILVINALPLETSDNLLRSKRQIPPSGTIPQTGTMNQLPLQTGAIGSAFPTAALPSSFTGGTQTLAQPLPAAGAQGVVPTNGVSLAPIKFPTSAPLSGGAVPLPAPIVTSAPSPLPATQIPIQPIG